MTMECVSIISLRIKGRVRKGSMDVILSNKTVEKKRLPIVHDIVIIPYHCSLINKRLINIIYAILGLKQERYYPI